MEGWVSRLACGDRTRVYLPWRVYEMMPGNSSLAELVVGKMNNTGTHRKEQYLYYIEK